MPSFICLITDAGEHVILIMTPQLCDLLRSIQKVCDALKPDSYKMLLAQEDVQAVIVCYNHNMRAQKERETKIFRVVNGMNGIDLNLC
jgi:hypothetical protein